MAHGSLSISDSDLMALPVPVPAGARSVAEQKKIAECLSSVDELIAAQARKVDALKTYKKGLMQQLFPREGETQPRHRFPEFQKAEEWEVKPLGELVELQSGFAFSSSNFGSGGRKLVTPKNFTKHGHGNFDETVSKYTTEEVPERFVCKPGDLLVLLTDLTPTCELLGKPLLIEEEDGTVLLNQRVARIEPSASELETVFLKYVFLSEPYSNRIVKTATGSTVKHSSNRVLQEMSISLPALPEQQRIASCLSSLDALITAETQKLEALKTHKKGLMQQLFPSAEGVEA
jgi:type I restriction enzyme, S subunit